MLPPSTAHLTAARSGRLRAVRPAPQPQNRDARQFCDRFYVSSSGVWRAAPPADPQYAQSAWRPGANRLGLEPWLLLLAAVKPLLPLTPAVVGNPRTHS